MKLKVWKNRLSLLTVIFSALIMLTITSNINWGKDHWTQIVRSDGEGYYAYLPAVFIYHDLNFSFFDEVERVKYHDPFNFQDYRGNYKGKNINKYFAGTAVAIMPFFHVAHLYAWLAGFPTDGYSKPYPIAVSIATFFYLVLGLYFLRRLLTFFMKNQIWISVILLSVLFGTNLFYYTVGEPSMSHVYSFAFINIFLYLLLRYFSNPKPIALLPIALVLGMIVLIRPVNGLILLAVPFAAGNYKSFSEGIKLLIKKPLITLVCLCAFLLLVFVQLFLYYLATDSFFIYSYGKEYFDFLNPHFIDFLFSYKKGFFLYTPIAFISLVGLWFFWKKNRFRFFSLFLFLAVIIFVFSSWWNWWYGGSFSSRVMTDFLCFFAIMAGTALEGFKTKPIRLIYLSLIFLLLIFCQIQTFQYRYHKIHWSEMNKELYWDVFMRIDKINK